eukprot:gnl/TRDRNA2_/TRDRNA2_159346_c0_seq3.p1 gnl/TRDRNA2_/TRDRNA2_159346_c0~~gnl/TRDRNA2_/TRDRNA2_159346_c0_seq3.p1  ORF type:complete len:489 (-),score=72.75 gnl/TRDRNA2_/TRDRNA2_159346_c0_seq3:101-1567(-)
MRLLRLVPMCIASYTLAAQRLEACNNRSSGDGCLYAGALNTVHRGLCLKIGPENRSTIACVAEQRPSDAGGRADPGCLHGYLHSRSRACCPRLCGDCSERVTEGMPEECLISLILRMGEPCSQVAAPCVVARTQGALAVGFLEKRDGNSGRSWADGSSLPGVAGSSPADPRTSAATPSARPPELQLGNIRLRGAAAKGLVLGVGALLTCWCCCAVTWRVLNASNDLDDEMLQPYPRKSAEAKKRKQSRSSGSIASDTDDGASAGFADQDMDPSLYDDDALGILRISASQPGLGMKEETLYLEPGVVFLRDLYDDDEAPVSTNGAAVDETDVSKDIGLLSGTPASGAESVDADRPAVAAPKSRRASARGKSSKGRGRGKRPSREAGEPLPTSVFGAPLDTSPPWQSAVSLPTPPAGPAVGVSTTGTMDEVTVDPTLEGGGLAVTTDSAWHAKWARMEADLDQVTDHVDSGVMPTATISMPRIYGPGDAF